MPPAHVEHRSGPARFEAFPGVPVIGDDAADAADAAGELREAIF